MDKPMSNRVIAMMLGLACTCICDLVISAEAVESKTQKINIAKAEITFKGLHFGKSGQWKQVLQMCLASPAKDVYRSCETRPNENNYELDQVSFMEPFGTLADPHVSFSKGESESLIHAYIFYEAMDIKSLVEPLTSKYGVPKVTPLQIKMRMGGSVDREILAWKDRFGTTLTLSTAAKSRDSDTDIRYGSISIESVEYQKLKKLDKDKAIDAIKSNL